MAEIPGIVDRLLKDEEHAPGVPKFTCLSFCLCVLELSEALRTKDSTVCAETPEGPAK
uniref:Uncharacterized protein n=1 Tax=Arundo donax TaxID=35708 RepID=A0A0A9CXI0_ARUDO